MLVDAAALQASRKKVVAAAAVVVFVMALPVCAAAVFMAMYKKKKYRVAFRIVDTDSVTGRNLPLPGDANLFLAVGTEYQTK